MIQRESEILRVMLEIRTKPQFWSTNGTGMLPLFVMLLMFYFWAFQILSLVQNIFENHAGRISYLSWLKNISKRYVEH